MVRVTRSNYWMEPLTKHFSVFLGRRVPPWKASVTGKSTISRISFSPTFSYRGNGYVVELPPSEHDHYPTSLGKFGNTPMGVGSTHNIKIEKFENGLWQPLGDFPFASKYMSEYSTVTFNEELYLFGEFSIISNNLKTIHFTNLFDKKYLRRLIRPSPYQYGREI